MLPSMRPIQYAATIADLLTLDVSGMQDGDLVFVPGTAQDPFPKYFLVDNASEAPVDAASGIYQTSNAAAVGASAPGRFLKLTYATGGEILHTTIARTTDAFYAVLVGDTFEKLLDVGPEGSNQTFTPTTGAVLARAIVSGSAVDAGVALIRIRYNGATVAMASQSVVAGGSFSLSCENKIENLDVGTELTLPIEVEWSFSVATTISVSTISNQQATLSVSDVNND